MDIYFRNPENYIQEIQESNIRLVSWDMGDYKKRNIDPLKFMSIYFGKTRSWKMLIIAIEGAMEYDQESKTLEKPNAVYPTWRFHYGWDKLIDYCENPVGEDIFLCHSNKVFKQFVPVYGQPNKVIIYDTPNMNEHEGVQYLRKLMAVKQDYPDVEFILHNTASFRLMFGAGFHGVTFDPRMTAKFGSVILPMGRAVKYEDLSDFVPWVKLLGSSVRDLSATIFDRVMFNIESIRWANENYNKNVNFRIALTHNLDIDTEAGQYELVQQTQGWLARPGYKPKMSPGDGVICGACSMVSVCKFYREGAVCGVPKSESANLSNMFGTRDASVIIDGLLELTKIQAKRVGMDLQKEDDTGERDTLTDKRLKDLFDSGVKIAKLIDPNLNGKGTTVNVGVVGAAAIIAQQTPQELIAGAVRTLEANGIPRAEITGDTIRGLLEGVANRAAVHEVIEIGLSNND